jgi:hypothetical protein
MTIANVSQGDSVVVPQFLKTAQDAIHLPEVQEMLRRLSQFKLGIFMPHMHDEHTGEFRPLPDEVTQVEKGLEVTFQTSEEVASQTARFLPVGWCWRAGVSTTSAVCEMADGETSCGTESYTKHKMVKGN